MCFNRAYYDYKQIKQSISNLLIISTELASYPHFTIVCVKGVFSSVLKYYVPKLHSALLYIAFHTNVNCGIQNRLVYRI